MSKLAMTPAPYALVTPAKNEAEHLPRLVASVTAQTRAPARWIIVDDGSTDATLAVAREAAAAHDFVHVVSARQEQGRNFGSKVRAIEAGLAEIDTEHTYLGMLDADVSFASGYFAGLLGRMDARPHLGIAGGIVCERIDGRFVPQLNAKESVAGAVQTFRRECWDAIGGYRPLSSGGIDAAAEITARAAGWEVETFDDLEVQHHRRVSHGRGHVLRERFRQGGNHYALGYHPAFEALRCLYRVGERPRLTGSTAMLAGYLWAKLSGRSRVLPEETVAHLRREQLARLGLERERLRR